MMLIGVFVLAAVAVMWSVHDERVLSQLGVAVERFLHFFSSRSDQLPSIDLALESLSPGTVEIHLLIGAFVDDLKAMPRDTRGGFTLNGFVRHHVHDNERIGVIKHLHVGFLTFVDGLEGWNQRTTLLFTVYHCFFDFLSYLYILFSLTGCRLSSRHFCLKVIQK